MKRSEMIYDLMMFAIENNYFNVSDQYPDLIAKDILNFLEKKGMLPPSRFKKACEFDYKEYLQHPKEYFGIHDGYYGTFVNEWEESYRKKDK